MRLPGFSAENALYQSTGRYLASQGPATPANGVIPALEMTSLRRPDIIVSCRCPCCICIDGVCFCC